VLVAAPAYLQQHGTPAHPADLARHQLLLHDVLQQWPLHSEGKVVQVPATGALLRANNLNTLRGLAVAGAGIALLPWFMVRDALDAGSVQLVLPEHPPTDNSYYVVYPGRSHRPAALSALLEFIDEFGLASYLS